MNLANLRYSNSIQLKPNGIPVTQVSAFALNKKRLFFQHIVLKTYFLLKIQILR